MAILFCFSSCDNCDEPIRVGSYNLWRSDLGKGDYEWSVRKHRLVSSIIENGFDIFGAQEVDTRIQEELPVLINEAGGPDYGWFIFSPYSEDGGKGDKAQAIIYRKDRFEIIPGEHFWYSETPDVMSGGWDEMKFKRGGFYARFREKDSGKEFIVMHSHMPLGKTANLMASEILVAKAKEANPEDLPAIFIGDLNTVPESPSSEVLRNYWKDAYMSLPADKITGPAGTFNGAKTERDMTKARRIDYIYFRGDIEVLNYTCQTGLYDGFYPSDHCPIYTDILINR